MLFVSFPFLAFVAGLLTVYYLVPQQRQWGVLLLGSYVFYYLAGPKFVLFIALTSLTVWWAARAMGRQYAARSVWLKANKTLVDAAGRKAYKAQVKTRCRRLFWGALGLNLGILAVLKYTNFAIVNVNRLLPQSGQLSLVDLVLPMGISFYTFQAVGYLIDVYNEKYEAQESLPRFALFVSFFPQLVQGPISRYDDLALTLYQPHPFDGRVLSRGLQRMLWGYFKKVVIADRLLVAVNTIIRAPEDFSGGYVAVGMLFYAAQLYCDFTGGIDITIGLAEALGIRLKENFQRPYLSRNIEEYWRRWHITMGTWFRDYIFYPLMVSKTMLHLGKRCKALGKEQLGRKAPVYLSTLLVWFATGLWHGASWNFIVWGLLNGIIIILSQELTPFYQWFHRRTTIGETRLWTVVQVLRTFGLMCLLRSLDCYRDVGMTFRMLGTLFTGEGWGELASGGLLTLGLSGAEYGLLVFSVALVAAVSVWGTETAVRDRIARWGWPARYTLWTGLVLFILVFGAYGIGFDSSQFIYNQF